ncbi:MAG: hypothetical protein IT327_23690 [Anaerolineae bacterium]|nr:hypothetical protein [Anaerolineae bacterium]
MSKQRKVQLTDEVWATTQERAVLEGKTASDICEHVLQHYLELDEKPPAQITAIPAGSKVRSVYISQITWAEAKGCKVREDRPIGAILEQQLRAYLGLPISK